MSSPSVRLKNLIEFLKHFDADASAKLVRTSWAALVLSGGVVLLITLLTLRHQKDFSQDYFAAQAFFEGSSIYSNRVVELGNIFNGRGIKNAHPPSLVLAIMPISVLPYPLAFLLFTLVSLFSYGIALYLAGRLIGLAQTYLRLLISASLLWPATLQSVHQGSISFLIASLTILGWVNIKRHRTVTAAGFLGIATALKFFPGILIVPFILRRNWQGCLTFIVSFSSMIIASLVVFGLDNWEIFVRTIAPHVNEEFSTHYANVSLWAYILPWFTVQPYLPPLTDLPILGHTVALFSAAALLGLGLYSEVTTGKRSDREEYSYWLWALCSVLLAPVSWQYSLTFLPVPVALLLRNAICHNRPYLFGATCAACVCLILADYDSYSLLLKRVPQGLPAGSPGLYLSYLLHTKIQSTGVFLLFGLLVAIQVPRVCEERKR
jgi:hypothetical protein